MSIIDANLVRIEMSVRADDRISRLKLDYQGQTYDLVRVVATHPPNPARIGAQLQQAIAATNSCLVVAEANYYSLWTIERAISTPPAATQQAAPVAATRLELQQASIWLLQELWVQWESSLGARQFPAIVEGIIAATPALQSRPDLERLLAIDPLAESKLDNWHDADFEILARHLYDIAHNKLGRQFGTELTIEILGSMPTLLQATLVEILEL
jgi:hypothetical protein